ncbi:MAG TPA: DUF1015 domain-containing protein [Candidatus Binataceae bacterium]|nr:DUF1015 domain-containing protein [Candidatus Binataceae bacterium]
MTSPANRIEPFSALIFDAKVGPLRDLIAPPYDLVDAAQQDALYARNPHNVIRLELNRDPDPYASAATTLKAWIRERVLVRHTPPALFHYTQRFEVAGKLLSRVGIIARVGLEPFNRGGILPHERTFPKAKEDRLKLLSATRTNVSPIFGLYPSDASSLQTLVANLAARPPLLAAVDDRGVANEIRAITAPAEITAIQGALAAQQILIADGHHRYETALEYQRRRRAAEALPSAVHGYDSVMMMLVAFDDPGLVILPTHRVVRAIAPAALASFAARAREFFALEEFSSAEALQSALAGVGHGALGVALKGQALRLLTSRDPAAMAAAAPDLPLAVRDLDVARLHSLILDRICGISADQIRQGGNISYTIDAPAALATVARGEADGVFLMNPPGVADVARVSASGATMPEKSTYFFPKLVTGMVLNPLDDELP